MSDDYKSILNTEAKTNPCVGLSQADGFMSLRLEFKLKKGQRFSFPYAVLNEVCLNGDTLSFQFSETEIAVKGLALSHIMDEISFHRVLWLAEGDNDLSVADGEPYIEAISINKAPG